jgi:hypothetical protein
VYDVGGADLLDDEGHELWGFDARETGWLGPNTVAAAGKSGAGAAIETVRMYDLSGNQTGEVSTVFESAVYGGANKVFAGVYPATDDNAQGTTFSIWNGTAVSAPQGGNAQAWSEDGSQLAVLLPPFTNEKVLMDGRLAIVDETGKQVFHLDGWYGSTLGDYEFSPDARYLAACLTQDTNDIEQGAVVDTVTGDVSVLGGACGGLAWTDEPALYAPSTGLGKRWVRWTPGGATELVPGAEPQDVVVAAPNGNLAIAATSRPDVLELVVNGVSEERQLPGPLPENGGYLVPYASWRPDGKALAVVYSLSGTTDGAYALEIIHV